MGQGRNCDDIIYRCENCKAIMCISCSMQEKFRTIGSRFSGIASIDPDKFTGDIRYTMNNLSRCCKDPDWRRRRSGKDM